LARVSASSTSQILPQTLLEARKQVAMPMALAMKLRRSIPSFLDFSSAISPIRCSTCFCFWLWGRGMNSSLDKTCVGMGESTPFLRSRSDLRIHIFYCPSFFKLQGCEGVARIRLVAASRAFCAHQCIPGESPSEYFSFFVF